MRDSKSSLTADVSRDVWSPSRASGSLGWHPVLQPLEGTVLGESFDGNSVAHDFTGLLQSHEISHSVLGETVLSANEDHLAAWELVLGASEGELGDVDEFWLGSD